MTDQTKRSLLKLGGFSAVAAGRGAGGLRQEGRGAGAAGGLGRAGAPQPGTARRPSRHR